MQEKKRKFPLTAFEVVASVIAIPILLYSIWRLLVVYGLPDMLTGTHALLAVLAFDIIWIVAMRLWPVKNLRIKIYPTMFIIVLSLVFVMYLIVGHMLSDMMY